MLASSIMLMSRRCLMSASRRKSFRCKSPNPLKAASFIDWIVQCFTSPPTQYRLYGRRFLQVKRPNQQYQSTEGKSSIVQLCVHSPQLRNIADDPAAITEPTRSLPSRLVYTPTTSTNDSHCGSGH